MVEVETSAAPVRVYADFESTDGSSERIIRSAIMVGYETSESDECRHHCTARIVTGTIFRQRWKELAVDDDGDDQKRHCGIS